MAYIQLNGKDYSMYCNKLVVDKKANYNAQTNAGGNTVVDFINHKRIIHVGIIPLDNTVMAELQQILNNFSVSITFLNPQTKELETIICIIPEANIEYYTIQANKVSFNAFELEFIEL